MEKFKLVKQFINCTDVNFWFTVPNQVLYAQEVLTFESVTFNNIITPTEFINTSHVGNVYVVNSILSALKLAREINVNIEEVYEPCEMKKAIWSHIHICYKVTNLRSVGTFTKILMRVAKLFGTRNECGMCGACTMEDSCASIKQ